VEKCLIEEAGRLAGLTVLIRPDATTTVRYVNKGSGPSKMLTAIMKRIWTICLRYGISLRAEHFKGEQMVGCGVDSLSNCRVLRGPANLSIPLQQAGIWS
jgi:hypothetical protein